LSPNIEVSLQNESCFFKTILLDQRLADVHSEVLKHLAYSPDSAPVNYYYFPNLKKHLTGRKFLSTEEALLAVDGYFTAHPKEFLLDALQKLEQQKHMCEIHIHRVNTYFQSHSLILSL
jgi:hypothetical protein